MVASRNGLIQLLSSLQVFLWGSRGGAMGAFSVLFIYTPEVSSITSACSNEKADSGCVLLEGGGDCTCRLEHASTRTYLPTGVEAACLRHTGVSDYGAVAGHGRRELLQPHRRPAVALHRGRPGPGEPFLDPADAAVMQQQHRKIRRTAIWEPLSHVYTAALVQGDGLHCVTNCHHSSHSNPGAQAGHTNLAEAIFAAFCLGAAVAVMALPIETKGRALQATPSEARPAIAMVPQLQRESPQHRCAPRFLRF